MSWRKVLELEARESGSYTHNPQYPQNPPSERGEIRGFADIAGIAYREVVTGRPESCCPACGNGRYVLVDHRWQCQRCAGMSDQEANARKLPTLSLSAQWKQTAEITP